ncbi:MAG TPA: 23S rRNA (guanosine(2251)-2'-O)-methyltransferase RlmB [Cyclobacteriaceae bacterium]|nr:23S rRNA (guanosine(2251)-2'-O)-methyltransferase RlmB [Cyclobacteriaceae bacterium]
MTKTQMIFGTRAVMEAIRSGREIEKIFVQAGLSNGLIKELISEAKQKGVPYSFTPQEKLNHLGSKNHQGVVCMLATIQYAKVEDIIDKAYADGKEPFLLILDRITDVRNFGAIARTAECAGIDAIVISDKGNAPITSDAIKTSSGALNHLPVCRATDLKKLVQQLKDNGIRVIACTEKTTADIYSADFKSPLALVIGSEEDGISPELLKAADGLVKIPLKGKVGSLNVSVAAGIAIYEAIRQKEAKTNS